MSADVPPTDVPPELEPPELAAVPPDPALLLVALDPASALLVLDRLLEPAELLAGWLPLLPEPLEQPSMATPKMVASKGLIDERPGLIGASSVTCTLQPLAPDKPVQNWRVAQWNCPIRPVGSMLQRMAKRNRRSFGSFLRGAVKDVMMPTSVGLGLVLGGCGSSEDKPDSLILAVMPPVDGAARADGPGKSSDARLDSAILAIMPPDAAVDRRVDTRLYAIMPPRDAGPDTRDARPDFPIYAIMPLQKDAAQDTRDGGPDYRKPYIPESPDLAWPDTQDTMAPDATKPPKEVGPIYAIMPLAVLPPRG